MSVSLVTAVRTLVLNGIKATPAFTTPDPTTKQKPDVRFGWKNGWTAREKVFTGAVEFNHKSASMRPDKTFRKEDATFELILHLAGLGQTEEQVSVRMDTLGLAIEDWVATHANWNGQVTGLNWVQIQGRGSQTPAFNDKGVLLERVYPINYNARLT